MKYFSVISLLFCHALEAQTITDVEPGFILVNEFIEPSGATFSLGDILFSEDGDTIYILSDSDTKTSAVQIASVVRNDAGDVTGFGSFEELFAEENMVSGLIFAPGTDTLLYRRSPFDPDNYISQRTNTGTIIETAISDYDDALGGLAFVPSQYSNAGQLLSTSSGDQAIFLHTVSDNLDSTYTISETSSKTADFTGFDIADIEYITSGAFQDRIVMAVTSDTSSSLAMISVDDVTGLPLDGASMYSIASGTDSAFGVAIDPITLNIWVVDYLENSITQIRIDTIFKNSFD